MFEVAAIKFVGARLAARDDAFGDLVTLGGIQLFAPSTGPPFRAGGGQGAEVRSRIMARSNSAKLPIICIIIQESLGAIIPLYTGGFVGIGKVALELPERAENVKDQPSARRGGVDRLR